MPIQPRPTENEQEFISRCMSEETKTYPQDQSYAICKSKWDTNMGAVDLTKQNMLNSVMNHYEAKLATINLKMEGVNLADYPWEDCIRDMEERYGVESAPRICGYIKSTYGGGE